MFDFFRRAPQPFARERICFLHIGPHKTASTSLQHALSENVDRLAAAGLVYPLGFCEDGRPRRNHTALARRTLLRLPGALEDAPVWSEFDALLARTSGSILLSSEHFAIVLKKRQAFRKVVGFFERHGFRVVLVAFVRDQPLWLNSWYTQHQKNLVSRAEFPAFAEHLFKRGHVDPWRFLGPALLEGRADIRPIAYERAVKRGLAKSFLAALGAPDGFQLEEPPRINPNFGIKGMFAAQEIMRRVEMPVRTLPDYIPLYQRFLALMRGRGWEDAPYIALDQAQYGEIRERFHEGNERFAQQYFETSWDELAPERTVERAVFDPVAAAPEDMADVTDVVDQMTALIAQSRRAVS